MMAFIGAMRNNDAVQIAQNVPIVQTVRVNEFFLNGLNGLNCLNVFNLVEVQIVQCFTRSSDPGLFRFDCASRVVGNGPPAVK